MIWRCLRTVLFILVVVEPQQQQQHLSLVYGDDEVTTTVPRPNNHHHHTGDIPNETNTTRKDDSYTCSSSSSLHKNNKKISNDSCHDNTPLLQDTVPTITLHNGVKMPLLLLGTAQLITKIGIDPSVPEQFVGMVPERTFRQIELALQNGIRAFDTALIYRSHIPIGYVLGEWWRSGKLQDRNDIWIQTKIFHPNAMEMTFGITHMSQLDNMTPIEISQLTLQHAEISLQQLNVGYVDLLLLHWPSGVQPKNDDDNVTTTTTTTTTGEEIDWSLNNEYNNRQRRIAAWKVLENLYSKGWARAIGVSNFSVKHLEQLKEDGATIIPMVNQIEASITLQYTDIAHYCIKQNIVPQAYSPFGRQLTDVPIDLLHEMVQRHKKQDYGQIIIKFLLQIGYSVVFLSNSPKRMVSNMDFFDDFYLSLTDILTLKGLNQYPNGGGWGLPSPDDLL